VLLLRVFPPPLRRYSMIWFLSQTLSHTPGRWHHASAPSGSVRPLHALGSMWEGVLQCTQLWLSGDRRGGWW